MSTITRELAKLFRKITNSEIDAEGNAHVVLSPADSLLINNARIALASLEAEAVGEVVLGEYDDCGCHPDAKVVCIAADGQADWENFKDGTRLYTATPAPVSVPDENGLLPCPCCGGNAEFDYDDDNLNWISCNVCGISTDTAYHTDVDARDKLREVWNRRAAMLQGEPTDDERIMAIEGIHNCERCGDEGWIVGEMGITSCACGQAGTLINEGTIQAGNSPVITGAEQRIADAVELLQKAAPAMLADNSGPDGPLAGRLKSPVIPDGWKLVPIDPTKDMLRAGQSVVGFWLNTVHCYSKMLAAAPAAPQQEVNNG